MSVYSGFATRQLELFYDQLLNKALELLSHKLLAFYNSCKVSSNSSWCLELTDERLFAKKMLKIHRTLTKLEEQKYLEPVQSTVLDTLVQFLRKSHPRGESASNSTIMMGSSSINTSLVNIRQE
jgi:hypothetical protein